MTFAAYSYRNDETIPVFKDDKPIIVFDGHCVLCSRWAQFVLKHDTQNRFRLMTAQSDLGEALYAHYGLKTDDYNTNLLIENGHIRTKSDGSLAMFGILGMPWSLVQIFRIIPRFILDPLYSLVARNRFKWFGMKEVCFLPPKGEDDRFI